MLLFKELLTVLEHKVGQNPFFPPDIKYSKAIKCVGNKTRARGQGIVKAEGDTGTKQFTDSADSHICFFCVRNHVRKALLLISAAVAKDILQSWAHELADICKVLRMIENAFGIQRGIYVLKKKINKPLKEKVYQSRL